MSVRFNDEKSAVDQVESDSSWYMQSVMEVPPNKLEYIEQIGEWREVKSEQVELKMSGCGQEKEGVVRSKRVWSDVRRVC